MVKTRLLDTVPCTVTKATELKKQWKTLAKAILDKDDYNVDTIDEAIRILSSLKEMKLKQELTKAVLDEDGDSLETIDEAMRTLSALKELKLNKSSTHIAVVAKAKATELKKELERVVKAILDEDACSVERVDEAIRVLNALKELTFQKQPSTSSSSSDSLKKKKKVAVRGDGDVIVPEEFKCPLSKEIMKEPVVLASGETYDLAAIKDWLSEGHRTCPQTLHVLSHTILTPNNLVQEMISRWCKEHGIELPKPDQHDVGYAVTDANRNTMDSLLAMMSSSLSDQKDAAKSLRQLTKTMPAFRALFSQSPDAIAQLLLPLTKDRTHAFTDLQENLITTVLNLSISDNNKRLIAESPHGIPVLIDSLTFGNMETRSNAAAALFSISAIDSNKKLIGDSGALGPLVNLLEEGNLLAMRDAASAILRLCHVPENRERAASEGAVRVILKKIKEGVLVDELLPILARLDHLAVEEMGKPGFVPCLFKIIRESNSQVSKEYCAAILCTTCSNDKNTWKDMRKEETNNSTLYKLTQIGTSRAKRKADKILKMLHKPFFDTLN